MKSKSTVSSHGGFGAFGWYQLIGFYDKNGKTTHTIMCFGPVRIEHLVLRFAFWAFYGYNFLFHRTNASLSEYFLG